MFRPSDTLLWSFSQIHFDKKETEGVIKQKEQPGKYDIDVDAMS